MPISLDESLVVFGNSNHLGHFLTYYETKIEEYGETEKDLTYAPNYFAWVYFASEQVFYRVKEMVCWNEQNEKTFDWTYKTLLDHLFSTYTPDVKEREALLLFAKIRHILVHKGFPNPHVTPSNNKREIAKGHIFEVSEIIQLTSSLSSPKFYPSLRKKFSLAITAISSFEKEVNQNFGSCIIKKKRSK